MSNQMLLRPRGLHVLQHTTGWPLRLARASASTHYHRRSVCNSKGHAVSSNIIQVLKDELKYQKEKYRPSVDLEDGPPEPFELDTAPGTKSITLTRTYGKENILVQLSLDQQSPPEEDESEEMEEDDAPFAAVTFTVNVFKRERVMTFECESDIDSITIKHVELIPIQEEEEEAMYPSYTGPVFSELDDTLKQAFVDYLEDRGVTGDLASYLIALSTDKSWNEYMAWLTDVKEFIAE